jgi:hypothetical protein
MAATGQAVLDRQFGSTLAAAFAQLPTQGIGANNLDLIHIAGKGGALLAKVDYTGAVVGGSTDSSSNVLTSAAVSTLTLTQSAVSSFVLTAVASTGGNTTYTGTITGGGANAFAGKSVIIAGFATSTNNGTFTIASSTATTIVVVTTVQTVDETHAGTAQVSGVSQTTYTGTITGGGASAFAGKTLIVAGFATSGNNGTFTIVDSSATTLVVTTTTQANETHAGTAQVSGVSQTTYNGTFPGGASNALAGLTATIAGFSTSGNNGAFTIVSSTASTIVVTTTTQANETHAGTAAIALTGTKGTRVGRFQTYLTTTATLAALFAAAFSNSQNLDILQVVNEGGNVVYYLDYLGVAH